MFDVDRYTLFYFFIGLSVFVFTQAVYLLVQKPIARRLAVNRRMRMILAEDDRDFAFSELMYRRGLNDRGQYRYPFLRDINRLVVQSGLSFGVMPILLSAFGVMIISFAILVFLFGLPIVLSTPLALLIGFSGPLLFLSIFRRKRQARFSDQLPEALEVMARSLRAGHPLPVALSLVAKEMPDPVGTEFGIVSDEIAYGRALPIAMRNAERRVGLEDMSVLTTAIVIQNETGGNLMEILESLSELMRERIKMRRKVRTLTSEGRFSATTLSVLPFLMFGAFSLISPQFYGEVWEEPATKVGLIFALLWMMLGNFVMYRMVNFKA
jgi:tight adherence protein B